MSNNTNSQCKSNQTSGKKMAILYCIDVARNKLDIEVDKVKEKGLISTEDLIVAIDKFEHFVCEYLEQWEPMYLSEKEQEGLDAMILSDAQSTLKLLKSMSNYNYGKVESDEDIQKLLERNFSTNE